jgi:release factor glutamine methyltransferase
LQYLSDPEATLSEELRRQLERDLAGLRADVPVQHLLGEVSFDGLRLAVGPGALIPRPETEELIWQLKKSWPFPPPGRILDVGTGTGCLALACQAHWPQAAVLGLDKSADALALAAQNGGLNQLAVRWQQGNFLESKERPAGPWDLILSNPPYVRPAEKDQMEAQVWQHEPAEALFTPADDPLLFYRIIAETYPPPTPMALELNRSTATEVRSLFEKTGHGAQLGTDSSEVPRFLWVNFTA